MCDTIFLYQIRNKELELDRFFLISIKMEQKGHSGLIVYIPHIFQKHKEMSIFLINHVLKD